MKKLIALMTAAFMLASFAACSKTDTPPSAEETKSFSETQTAENSVSETRPDMPESTTEESSTQAEITTVPAPEPTPSEWTNEEIIDFYKKAAEKSNPKAKSTQVMNLTELIINDGDGVLGFFIRILEPAISKVVEKNAFDFDGITGGFTNLDASDAQSLKAYKSGEYTVIEMTMKEQVDGINGSEYEGTVGHAITVLGSVSKVIAEFPQFDVDLSNADIAVHYTNPTVKVKINKDGIIEKGTWKYTCDPEIRNISISGIDINKADAKIDYIITVGGGF